MKIGFNLLLWSTHIVEADFTVLEKLKATGYDGVELPIFDTSDLAHFEKIGSVLKDIGLACTAVTVCPDEEHNPISPDAANRQGAIEHINRVLDCAAAAGAEVLCGPFYQVLGQFTGAFPSEEELAHAAEVHKVVADHAEALKIKLGIESLNRFESHLLNTMAQAKSYVRRVNKPAFGTMYDTFHANIEEKDPLGALKDSLDVINHVHISENDRGTPGRGHNPLVETIQLLKSNGYDKWLTIEAFGGALPDLAAATRVWRNFFPNEEEVYTEGYKLIRETWDNA
ncbi:MAG: sugar phosphate isomerase/epimerase [Verrucomicrobia bacterium]|nr:sugar phosphate isomerase/epimerase [Verrucomicrobiota bacterium]